MPHAYETMRDKFVADGMSLKDAQTKAARIYNAKRKPGEPAVGKGHKDIGREGHDQAIADFAVKQAMTKRNSE